MNHFAYLFTYKDEIFNYYDPIVFGFFMIHKFNCNFFVVKLVSTFTMKGQINILYYVCALFNQILNQ
jgi:hypothetical protein